jgi:hypothetical protein
MNNFAELTTEQRAAALEKAKLVREENKLQRERNKETLKMSYLDSNNWATLASLYKIRMPLDGLPASVPVIRKYLKKAELSVDTWNEHYTSMKYFVQNNPKWTAQAVVGLILELKHEYCAN